MGGIEEYIPLDWALTDLFLTVVSYIYQSAISSTFGYIIFTLSPLQPRLFLFNCWSFWVLILNLEPYFTQEADGLKYDYFCDGGAKI